MCLPDELDGLSQLPWPVLAAPSECPPPPPPPPSLTVQASAFANAEAATATATAAAAAAGILRCRLCGKVFHHRYNLQKHHRVKHTPAGQDRPFECLACGKLFKTRQHLRNHTAAMHDPAKQTKGVLIASESTSTEKATARGGSTSRCFACDSPLPAGAAALRRHLADEHCAAIAGACLACGQEFFSAQELRQHMLAQHTASLTINSCASTSSACAAATNNNNNAASVVASLRLLRCRLCPPRAVDYDDAASSAAAAALPEAICRRGAYHSYYRAEAAAPLWRHLSSAVHCSPPGWLCRLCRRRFERRSACQRHLWRDHHQRQSGGEASATVGEHAEHQLCQLCPLDVGSTVVVAEGAADSAGV